MIINNLQKRCSSLTEKAAVWVSVGGCQICRRKHRWISTKIQISDGISDKKHFRKSEGNSDGIPSESYGNSDGISQPVFQKNLDLVLNCSVTEIDIQGVHFNGEERESELQREREGARKGEKEGDVHGFRWPVTQKNYCRRL